MKEHAPISSTQAKFAAVGLAQGASGIANLTVEVPCATPLIEIACRDLDAQIDSLREAVSALDNRLGPVKRSQTFGETQSRPQHPAETPLQGRIMDFEFRIREIETNVRTVLALLEV